MNTDVGVAVATVLAAVVAVVGAYFFGVSRSRNERRDAALAEIFKEMMLFYRGVVAWTSPNQTSGPLTQQGTSWRDYSRQQYEVFLNAFYGNAIWLGKNTQEMIQGFADAGKDLLNGIDHQGRRMSNGTSAWDWRAENLAPKLNDVEDALRAEMEASRYIIPYRIVIKKNAPSKGETT